MAPTLSEVFKDHPIHLQHIIPIDFSSAQTLPDSHAWSQSDGFSSGSSSSSSPSVFPDTAADDELFSIPLIDLVDPNASELICQACESWGAFQLIGHGIPSKLIEEVHSESRRLFALPSEQKLKTLRSPGGAAGYGIARISPFFQKYMWHEGFTILASSLDHAKQLWPHDYERFCETMDEYQKQMKVISHKLIRMMLKQLNISEEEDAKWIGSTTESSALQLNSYPACPDPERAMGLAPHTDTSLMTLVHQSQISGLQIHKQGVGWVRVQPISGALAINVGDLLHILSNGRFPSALHRVTVNQTMQRFSVAYFYGPPVDFTVSPLLSKVSSSGEAEAPLYRSVTVKEYVGMKAKYLEKALSLLKN